MYTKLYVLYTVLFFFNSGGSVDDVLVRSLVVQIITGAKLMCISFSVKNSDIFGIVNELVQFVYIPIYSTIGDENMS